jgi:hypothetical protein
MMDWVLRIRGGQICTRHRERTWEVKIPASPPIFRALADGDVFGAMKKKDWKLEG